MSRFHKLSHALWYCEYHIVWVPKYRFRILEDKVKSDVETCTRTFVDQQKAEVVELNVQLDHVHLIAMVLPKIALSSFVGTIKGRTAIRVFNKFRQLKTKPYWGNHIWATDYCIDTVGLNAEMIRKYVKYQEAKERRDEQHKFIIY